MTERQVACMEKAARRAIAKGLLPEDIAEDFE
jgi:predicted amidohydrolase